MKYLYIEKRQRIFKDLTVAPEKSKRAVRIEEEFQKAGLDYQIAHFEDLVIDYSGEQLLISVEGTDLREFTYIIFGGHHLNGEQYQLKQLIVRYAQSLNQSGELDHDLKVQNGRAIATISQYSKPFIHQLCIENDLPTLGYYYTPSGRYPEIVEETFGYPVIVKHIDGVNDLIDTGEERLKVKKTVFLVENPEDWNQERLVDKDLREYFIQEYSPVGEDYRTFISNGKFIGGWKRVAPQDNFMTVTKGAEYYYHNHPSDQMREIAERAASALKADFIAVDFIMKNDKPYILEFSLHPGFNAYENKCQDGEPVNIAEAIISSFGSGS